MKIFFKSVAIQRHVASVSFEYGSSCCDLLYVTSFRTSVYIPE